MSAGVVNLQAQVESVLDALVKAATVELTKLFESRYGATLQDAGRTESWRKNDISETPLATSTGDTKRSIGVQVDDDIYSPPEFNDGGSVEKEEKMNGSLIASEIPQAGDNGHVDPEWSSLKEQVGVETVDMVDLSFLDESPTDGEAQTEVVLQGMWTEKLDRGPTDTSPAKQKLLVVPPDTCDIISGGKVKFVCPLILKPQPPAPKPDAPEKPVQTEPHRACVSTAYTPSPNDGAGTPAQVGVWERVRTPKAKKSNLHMKLKLTSPDKKLVRPCTVQLVNILTVPESETELQDVAAKAHDAKHESLPKDLRRHQGLHTGHRLCCFSSSGDGVWRLQNVVTHDREGYVCNICEKRFKRRKILRRHERFHTGEKPYACSVCSKTFALRKSLRRHVRFHTGERPHTCAHCNKCFRLRDNLKAHLRFHTGEKPFTCSSCEKTFRIMRNLEKHECEKSQPEKIFVPSFRKIAGL